MIKTTINLPVELMNQIKELASNNQIQTSIVIRLILKEFISSQSTILINRTGK